MPRLPLTYYQQNDVVGIARSLIGKYLVTSLDQGITIGMITETEAYHQNEKACHAYNGRRTKRTSILFEQGGLAYVYMCYGIHHLFNVTTGPSGDAAAVLIRAVEPIKGGSIMLQRRGLDKLNTRVSSGPGTASQALGLTVTNNGTSLVTSEVVWIEQGRLVPDDEILETTRIGVDYAGSDALLPWRFYLKSSSWVSRR